MDSGLADRWSHAWFPEIALDAVLPAGDVPWLQDTLVFQALPAKIEEKSDFEIGRGQVADHLSDLLVRQQMWKGFYLDDQHLFNQMIEIDPPDKTVFKV